MANRLQSDKILFGTVVALTLFGALMVFSASAVMATERFGSSSHFLVRQLAWAGAGLVALVVMMYLDSAVSPALWWFFRRWPCS